MVPDGVGGKVERDVAKTEVSRIQSLCFLLSCCLYCIIDMHRYL